MKTPRVVSISKTQNNLGPIEPENSQNKSFSVQIKHCQPVVNIEHLKMDPLRTRRSVLSPCASEQPVVSGTPKLLDYLVVTTWKPRNEKEKWTLLDQVLQLALGVQTAATDMRKIQRNTHPKNPGPKGRVWFGTAVKRSGPNLRANE